MFPCLRHLMVSRTPSWSLSSMAVAPRSWGGEEGVGEDRLSGLPSGAGVWGPAPSSTHLKALLHLLIRLSLVISYSGGRRSSFCSGCLFQIKFSFLLDDLMNSSAAQRDRTHGTSSVGSSPAHLGRVTFSLFMIPQYAVHLFQPLDWELHHDNLPSKVPHRERQLNHAY